MPENPKDEVAPLVSGLPELYPNILSGIKHDHFYPWGHACVDSAHYNCGGNNFANVARALRCWELLHVYGRKWNCWLSNWATGDGHPGIEKNVDLINWEG